MRFTTYEAGAICSGNDLGIVRASKILEFKGGDDEPIHSNHRAVFASTA